ncbi:MAG: hypothetical protein E5299_02482 [Burkholderia gladioli]|nr:MAG: hypothetical protein E5299_02482 [Burkholderia gladioli]
MGLIFLCHAYSRFLKVKAKIEETFPLACRCEVSFDKGRLLAAGSIFLTGC